MNQFLEDKNIVCCHFNLFILAIQTIQNLQVCVDLGIILTHFNVFERVDMITCRVLLFPRFELWKRLVSHKVTIHWSKSWFSSYSAVMAPSYMKVLEVSKSKNNSKLVSCSHFTWKCISAFCRGCCKSGGKISWYPGN